MQRHYGERICSGRSSEKKTEKKIQDAHEAIRPTDITRTPAALKDSLTRDQFRLYQLIWKRFAASRMQPANYETTSVKIAAGEYLFYSGDFQEWRLKDSVRFIQKQMRKKKRAMFWSTDLSMKIRY